MLLGVPSASFQVQSPDIGAIRGLFAHVVFRLIVDDFKVEIYLIDSDDILSGIVLLQSSQETLSEEESGYPHLRSSSFVNPALDELEPVKEVDDV